MGVLFHGRYNRNDLRNYPLVDSAGRRAVNGDTLPLDFLADASLRYPGPGGTPYIAGAVRTDNLMSAVLALRTADGNEVLGTASISRPASQAYQMVQVDGLPGVGGWVVFGAAATAGGSYRMTFDDPAQTELLPKVARAYPRPPVTAIARAGRAARLDGHVRVTGDGLVQALQATRRVGDADQRALVLRLNPNASAAALAAFISVCGRNSDGECSPPVIKALNNVKPDADGNIDIVVVGLPTLPLVNGFGEPEGIVFDMPIGLIDICQADKSLAPAVPPIPECE
jgi:hypothetical protein